MRFPFLILVILGIVFLCLTTAPAAYAQAAQYVTPAPRCQCSGYQSQGVAVAVPGQPYIAYNSYNQPVIVRPRVQVPLKEAWVVRRYGFWPFERTEVFYRLQ